MKDKKKHEQYKKCKELLNKFTLTIGGWENLRGSIILFKFHQVSLYLRIEGSRGVGGRGWLGRQCTHRRRGCDWPCWKCGRSGASCGCWGRCSRTWATGAAWSMHCGTSLCGQTIHQPAIHYSRPRAIYSLAVHQYGARGSFFRTASHSNSNADGALWQWDWTCEKNTPILQVKLWL